MQFKIKELGDRIDSVNTVFLSEDTMFDLFVFNGDLVSLSQKNKKYYFTVSEANIGNKIGLSSKAITEKKISKSDPVILSRVENRESIKLIFKKLQGVHLTEKEFNSIISDIASEILSEAEIAYFVSAISQHGLSLDETEYLTKSIAFSGDYMNWGSKTIVDKHCIGGIPGNRTTPIVVSICAAAGLTMPKTSSRAITSAAGTADSMEVLTKVAVPTPKLKEIVKKHGACLAWGGALGLAPADDLLIHVERKLNLDPVPQIVASILSKKIAAGSNHILIDIPRGKGAKVSDKESKELERLFNIMAKRFNLKLKVVFTDGTKPVGRGVGPVLEIIDVISVLKAEHKVLDLEKKSVFLAGQILELSGKAKKGKGIFLAQELLNSGKAYSKFNEIIIAQGAIKNPQLSPGPVSYNVVAKKTGKIVLNNQEINNLAKALGCPESNRAGVLLNKNSNSKISKGDLILTLYAKNNSDLTKGLDFIKNVKVFNII